MLSILRARIQQKHRTFSYPHGAPPPLPDRFRGWPVIDTSKCPPHCSACVEACPTAAIDSSTKSKIDLGRCLFCTECANACPAGAITHSPEYRLARGTRDDLIVNTKQEILERGEVLDKNIKSMFGRSLKLRQVSAGGCNACEADINVLGTVGWDLGRFGIQFVASPRHADGIVVTGPVTQNMSLALQKTWDAIPAPKIVVAVGACAISGGMFATNPQVTDGVGKEFKVDLYIPGCPPHPLTILDGLLWLIGRI